MNRTLTMSTIAFIGGTFSLSLLAADLGTWERFAVQVGAFVTDRVTKLSLDATNKREGTEVDFEDDLGLDDKNTVARLDGFYRYGRRSRVDFSYYDLDRRATRNATIRIRFGDEIFRRGDTITTVFKLDIFKVAYTYSFYRSDKLDIGISPGLHLMDIGTRLTESNGDSYEGKSYAPFPVLGVRVGYQITPKWLFKASSEWFGIETSKDDGRIIRYPVRI